MEFDDRCNLPKFARELWEFMLSKFPFSAPIHRSITAPSSVQCAIISNYRCSFGAFAKGASGTIFGGIDMAGNQVAIKRFWDPTKKELENHKRIMEKNGSHVSVPVWIDPNGS